MYTIQIYGLNKHDKRYSNTEIYLFLKSKFIFLFCARRCYRRVLRLACGLTSTSISSNVGVRWCLSINLSTIFSAPSSNDVLLIAASYLFLYSVYNSTDVKLILFLFLLLLLLLLLLGVVVECL